jgi:NtrC-family two-component system sensor histidine kinase KinB
VGRKKGGAGLGLALCKEIVQLHGGRMGVYSRPGQGTQFYMALSV